ncbi:MAG: hypothetical protein HZA03_02960 [Nitrospinae bacterium]|nr:hypothetical protein [Nitrospinota bacterium]
MQTTRDTFPLPAPEQAEKNNSAPPFWPFMAAGSALLFLSSMRFGVAELGWIAFAPFLAAMYTEGGLKRHLRLFAVIAVAMTLTVGKIVTDQVPWFMAPMFSIPGAVFCFATISLAAAAHRRLGLRWGIYLFPALAVTMEWLQYSFTDGGSWGALAYTQLDNLPLIQLASLTGITGVSFLVGLGSSLAAAAYTVGPRAVKRDFLLFAALTTAALVYGQLRLSQDAPGVPMRVAAVSSPLGAKEVMAAKNDISALRKYDGEFFARTEKAAALGAKTVVWNEAATIMAPADEAAFTARGQAMAKDKGIILVMAYGVLLSADPFHWENKYRMILPDGTVADEYFKRHPVPGDGHDAGTKHAKVVPIPGGALGGAICYDFDFPRIALDNARDGAGLVLLPSSDWRGIDPIHSRMARVNAVAAGVSMVRSVRAATSLATDQYGRELGSMRYFGEGDGVMVAAVPAQAVPTLYAKTGDVLPWLTLAFSTVAIALLARRKHA